MRIASSTVNMSSTHLAAEHSTRRESLRAWVGDRRPDFDAAEPGRGRVMDRRDEDANWPQEERAGDGADHRTTNARRIAGLALRLERQAAAEPGRTAKAEASADMVTGPAKTADEEEALDADPKARVIKLLVEAMTGRRIKLVSLNEIHEARAHAGVMEHGQVAQQTERAGWGVEYELHETHHEFEQTSFAAHGVVRTADGKEITFSYELEMAREYYAETNLSVRAGDALLKDPLVINFRGTAAQLTDRTYAFDLDADGTQDQIAWVQPGSGFLALDKNGNGTIDDGSELFGATSGNGFAELAAYDDDGNGWIDEADAVYSQLQIWSKSGNGDERASLMDRNVGAIYLGQQATPFELKDNANRLQGAVRSSGIYVNEDGSGVGSVQQIDLAI